MERIDKAGIGVDNAGDQDGLPDRPEEIASDCKPADHGYWSAEEREPIQREIRQIAARILAENKRKQL